MDSTITEVEMDEDPYTIKYWLVHEYYSDTQRLTKMIIDAGPGKNFRKSDVDKGMFTVHFQSTHWHYGTLDYATQTGVGYGNRIIDDAYVTNTNLNELAREMANSREDLYKGQSHLPKNDSGRYLVLEFYSERELREAGFVYDPIGHADNSASGVLTNYQMFQRTPGAESGWNDHSQFVQHKHDYYVTINAGKTLKRYQDSKIEEITKDKSNYSFALAAKKYNENELVPGHINVLFNLFEKGTWTFTPQNPGEASFFDYRLYKPAGSSGKIPLFVWLHGADGSRITDPAWTGGGFPDFLQNHGQLSGGSIGALVSPVMQNKYGPYFVLAPQAVSMGMGGGGHNPAQYKALIEKLAKEYPIDLKRIYFGGHSMGGMGTISMVLENPDFVAGAIAGPGGLPFFGASGNDPDTLNKLKNTPIWLVTIAGDNTTMDEGSVFLFDKLLNAGGNVRLTYFPVQQPYDWPGNYGHKGDPALPPWGYGWSHSAYEPMVSDQITTDYKYNVKTASYTENANATTGNWGQITLNRNNITFGRTASGDIPGDTLFTWLFKQHR